MRVRNARARASPPLKASELPAQAGRTGLRAKALQVEPGCDSESANSDSESAESDSESAESVSGHLLISCQPTIPGTSSIHAPFQKPASRLTSPGAGRRQYGECLCQASFAGALIRRASTYHKKCAPSDDVYRRTAQRKAMHGRTAQCKALLPGEFGGRAALREGKRFA